MSTGESLSRRQFLLTSGAATAVLLAGCTGDDDGNGNGGGDDNTILVGPSDDEFAFAPDELTVSVGTEVTWEWESDTHNIVVESQPDDADWEGQEEIENSGFTYSFTFEVPGTYEYYCQPHRDQGMEGTIIVEE
ncbi:MAG: plastocyanin/azurin family copper-binding protein [Halobacteriales archaeon]